MYCILCNVALRCKMFVAEEREQGDEEEEKKKKKRRDGAKGQTQEGAHIKPRQTDRQTVWDHLKDHGTCLHLTLSFNPSEYPLGL